MERGAAKHGTCPANGGELRLAPVSARAREQARAVPSLVTAGSLLAGVACAGPGLQRGSRMVDQFVLSKHLSDCGMKTCTPVLLQLYRSTAVSLAVPFVGVLALAER
jgi:hypothetical protein